MESIAFNRFMALLALLTEANFQGRTPVFVGDNGKPTDAANIWYRVLSMYPEVLLEGAILEVIETEAFFPAIATIVRHIKALIPPEPEPDGSEAWGKILAEMSRCGGTYGTPTFDNLACPDREIMCDVVNALGWRSCCLSTEDAHPAWRAQARAAYDSIAKRHAHRRHMDALAIGQAEQLTLIGKGGD